jgi:hypothetical protein
LGQFLNSAKTLSVVAPAFLAAVLLWPLWSVVLPAMSDYPAHVSALYVQMHGAQDAALSQFYQTEWDFVPDLASEILVPLIATVVPFLASVKLFLSLALVMWIAAPVAIHHALYKRFGVVSLAGALFAYNAPFMWGFINFYFACGLALLVFALWISTEERAGVLRTALFTLAALAVFFAHALGLLLLALLLLFFEMVPVDDDRRGSLVRRMGTVALVLLPSLVFFLFLRPPAEDAHQFSIHLIGTIPARLASAMQDRFDTAAYLPLAVLTVATAVGFYFKRITIHPRMIALLAAMLVFCLFAPRVAGGGWGTHIRFPAVLCLLFFASLDLKRPSRQAILAALILGLALFNAATLYQNWRGQDRQIAEFRQAMQSVPPGTALFTALDSKALGRAETRPYRHMAEYAIMDRGAFVPLMFTTRGQHVVHTRAEYESIASLSSVQGHEATLADLVDFAHGDFRNDENLRYLDRWQCHFDAVIVVHLGNPQSPVPPLLRLRRAHSFFSLYDVVRPPSCEAGSIKQAQRA